MHKIYLCPADPIDFEGDDSGLFYCEMRDQHFLYKIVFDLDSGHIALHDGVGRMVPIDNDDCAEVANAFSMLGTLIESQASLQRELDEMSHDIVSEYGVVVTQ